MYTAEQYTAIGDYSLMAILIAAHAHEGQVDKGGEPYILHPLRVGSYFTSGDWEPRVVGYLHDVIEDTEVTGEFLRDIFPPEITNAVVAISREKGEPDLAYLARVKANPLARRVKVSDARDNSDPERLAMIPDEKVRERLRVKYRSILALLEEG